MDLFGSEPEDIIEDNQAETIAVSENDGLPPPRQNTLCLGHESIEQQVLPLINESRMPHAMIFAGLEGIGKATFAFRLARFLLTQTMADPNQDSLFGGSEAENTSAETLDIPEDTPVFARIASGGHADLLAVERKTDEAKGKKAASLDVEQIRKVAPFLRLSASEGGWRIVIIDDADTMNRNAQNALLKILEEPPANTLIILIAHRAGALIPTIRSRARVINFEPLSDETLTKLLARQNHHLSAQEMQALNILAEGSIGKALHLLEEGGLDSMGKVLTIFENYPDWKGSEIHKLAEELGRVGQDQAFFSFQSTMQWIARQLSTAKARGQALPAGPLAQNTFQNLLKSSSLEHLIAIYDQLVAHFEQVNRANLERRHAVLKAFQIFV